jgi:hypothetical protein
MIFFAIIYILKKNSFEELVGDNQFIFKNQEPNCPKTA